MQLGLKIKNTILIMLSELSKNIINQVKRNPMTKKRNTTRNEKRTLIHTKRNILLEMRFLDKRRLFERII